MAEYNKDTLTAPVYRYYTTDLLTNKILAEIPFGSVSYERALKSAGAFSGKIPVLPTPSSRSWDLYKSTLPGKTGLYIMRDDQCVWGGIIWSRNYDLVSQTLNIDASEFPSYFHHRRIWKSWNHIYKATVVSSGGNAVVSFEAGSGVNITGGASVKFEFNGGADDPTVPAAWLAYNGYYTIATSPAPTSTQFTVAGAVSTAYILNVERTGNVATVYTKGAHGFTTGNIITINVSIGTQALNGTYQIVAASGSTSSYFTFQSVGNDLVNRAVTGVSTRPLPDATYTGVDVFLRSDTYDYIRSLVSAVFEDFNGIDFTNSYVEPGQRYKLEVLSKTTTGGYATITTKTDHGLVAGQAVDIYNVGNEFNGSPVVLDTPHTNTFRFKTGGEVPLTGLSPKAAVVIAREATKGVAKLTTSAPHNFSIGNTVNVYAGGDVDGNVAMFNGDQIITSIPDPSSFQYSILSKDTNYDKVNLSQPTATVNGNAKNLVARAITGNTVYFNTDSPHGFQAGQSVTVQGVDIVAGITDKNYDYVTNTATMVTDGVHYFDVGDVVHIDGLSDVSAIKKKSVSGQKITLTTTNPHNFKKGDLISVANVVDGYTVTNRSANSSNKVTVTLNHDTNVNSGDTISVRDVYEFTLINKGSILNNIAKVTVVGSQYIKVNDKIIVSGITEGAKITEKKLEKGVITLKTKYPHNFVVGQTMTISGLGKPFDGSFKLTDVSSTSIEYKIDSKATVKTTAVKSGGSAVGNSHKLNGTHTVSSVSGNVISYPVTANNLTSVDSGGSAFYLSPINGEKMTVASTTTTTVTYTPVNAVPSMSSVSVQKYGDKDDPNPRIVASGLANGTQMPITAVTRDTFTYSTSKTVRYFYSNLAVSAGSVTSTSIFNGNRTITSITAGTFSFALPTALSYNIKETPQNTPSYARASNLFSGTFTIGSVDAPRNTFTFPLGRTHQDIPAGPTSGYGIASVTPTVINSTFGPYPANSDLQILFSTQDYSGSNVTPTDYSGTELKNVGEALDAYSDSVNGFEYRIDCSYDSLQDKFNRIFVLLPIDYPDPPDKGEVSPPSRFGADQVVFEYPGNITTLSIAESAENSATRFFATGDQADTSDAAGTQVGIAAADDLLGAPEGERWPLLDDDEKIDNITNKDILLSYAERYLIEGRPPIVSLTVSVNGSLPPQVGFYSPGNWCSLIVNDEFVLQRLKSDLEPRDDILVRKIQSYKVTVPDGSTVPEKVDLTLVRESEVDGVGQ